MRALTTSFVWVTHTQSGLKELTSYPDCFRVIVRCLSYISTNKKSLIFELLAAILLLSEDLWKCVHLPTQAAHDTHHRTRTTAHAHDTTRRVNVGLSD